MRVSELEHWLLRMGWQPEPLKGGACGHGDTNATPASG